MKPAFPSFFNIVGAMSSGPKASDKFNLVNAVVTSSEVMLGALCSGMI